LRRRPDRARIRNTLHPTFFLHNGYFRTREPLENRLPNRIETQTNRDVARPSAGAGVRAGN